MHYWTRSRWMSLAIHVVIVLIPFLVSAVSAFLFWQDGIEATARTLEQDNFVAVRAALLANEADVAQHALWASPWAASHYGYGAAWPEARTQP